jgi:hypothetical protein
MTYVHITAAPGYTVDDFNKVNAKTNPPQDIDGLITWAMPCPGEVACDGQPGTGFGQGFHGDVDGGADGSVDAPHAPSPGCVDVG